jgi:hypothetical protein
MVLGIATTKPGRFTSGAIAQATRPERQYRLKRDRCRRLVIHYVVAAERQALPVSLARVVTDTPLSIIGRDLESVAEAC